MEKRTIARLSASAVCLGIATMGLTGVFSGGGDLSWQESNVDQRIQDGTYYAQKENQFSTVQVEMTFQEHRIADCVIHSFGAADLMTDEIRTDWASAIVESQSAAPDAITGATLSFSAASVQEAVEDILAQSVGEKERAEPFATEAEPVEDATEAPAPEITAAPETGTAQSVTAEPAAEPTATPELTAEPAPTPDANPDHLMRERPVITEIEAEAPASEQPTEPAQAPVTDGSRLMRERPVITEVEAEAPVSEQPEEPAQAPATDGSRLMRIRPVITEIETETPAENDESTDRFMRSRPSF